MAINETFLQYVIFILVYFLDSAKPLQRVTENGLVFIFSVYKNLIS